MPAVPARRIAFLLAPVLIAACDTGRPTRPVDTPAEPHFQSLAGAEWSTPVNLTALNSTVNEQNAILSKDELTIYFSSVRPGGLGGLDIWISHRESVESPWEAPVNLGPPINTAEFDFAPNLSIDGHLLFFSSTRPGGMGAPDIYVASRSDTHDDFAWEEPVNLGAPINTPGTENAPFYLQSAEDGSANLYFNRAPVGGTGDIYVASISREGMIRGDPVLVAELSDPLFNDAAVTIRRDGREVLFWSPRTGTLGGNDLWTSTRQSVHHPWGTPMNAGPILNTSVSDVTPHLSFDGRTLIFGSSRPGGLGAQDLWMSTR